MPCFASPGFGYGYMPRRMRCAPAWAACGPCGVSPCANPMFLVGAFFILPTLLKLMFFGMFALANVALTIAPIVMIAYLTHSLVDDHRARAWCQTKKPTNKTAADDDKKEANEEKELVETVHEDPSARVTMDADKIQVVIAVPGIRTADINARVIDDHVLRIIGKTKKGHDVYHVAKDIALPRVDVETMSAKHEDGVLYIEVKRKIHQVDIPITSSVEAAKEEGSEDGWEPLPAAANSEKTKAVTAG